MGNSSELKVMKGMEILPAYNQEESPLDGTKDLVVVR